MTARRKRNPRVVAREKMMEAKRWLGVMALVWQSTSYTYEKVEMEDGRTNHRRRPLREDERVENQPERLRELINYMMAVQQRCKEVEQVARERLLDLEEASRRG